MTEETVIQSLLGSKYTPLTHDYLISTKKDASSKALEGWFVAGKFPDPDRRRELVLARLKPGVTLDKAPAKSKPKAAPKSKRPAPKPKRRRH